jgi:hypothetical protein
MKTKLLLFALFMAMNPFIFGQTLLTQDFSSGVVPPSGWTIDAHASNWMSSASAHAGGTAPECEFFYSPSWTGQSRLITPQINTSGYTSLTLSFKHYVDWYTAPFTVGVASRSNNGTWNVVWSVNPTASIGPEMKVIQIVTTDVGSGTFQLCFYFSGYSYNINEWYIDDVKLEVSKARDGAMTAISVPQYSTGSLPVTGTFTNMGTSAITSVDVNYKIDQGTVHTTPLTNLNMALGDSHDFTCTDPLSLTPGDYMLNVWVSNVNNLGPDDNVSNDTMTKILHIASSTVARRPIYEEFTSSTCAPCASFNSTVFTPWLATYGDSISLIKYQMDWPGAGDPYYTEEGGVRRYFYGVSYVPDLYVEGHQVPTTSAGVNGGYANSIATPAFMDVSSSYYFGVSGTDTSIFVHLDIMPKVSGSLTAFVAVIEEVTYHNVATNGETQFHNVMMKFVPGPYGTPVTLVDGVITSIDVSANLMGTNIERWNDLKVITWVQDTVTREMFQASYGDTIGVGVREIPGLKQVRVYPNPSTGIVNVLGVDRIQEVSIFDNTGILLKEISSPAGNKLNLGELPAGIYMLRIQTRDGVKTSKVNIVR